jgi:hypothetical protein
MKELDRKLSIMKENLLDFEKSKKTYGGQRSEQNGAN